MPPPPCHAARFPDDFVYKVVEVKDALDANLLERIPDCVAFIEEYVRVFRGEKWWGCTPPYSQQVMRQHRALASGGRVLVHCFAGKSRSVTILCGSFVPCRVVGGC